jgi:hypothetical protein
MPLKIYNNKLKDSRFAKIDDSLIAEAVSAISDPLVVPLGFGLSPLSPPPGEFIAKTSSVVVRKTSTARGILRRGFLNPSSSVVAQPSPEVMVKGGPSVMVRCRDDVGDDGVFPLLGAFLPLLRLWTGL